MTSDNGGFIKAAYDEMMEQFCDDGQKKHEDIDELNVSSTLARGSPAPSVDEVPVSFKERQTIEVVKSTSSSNVTIYPDTSSSKKAKKLFQGTHISSEAKSSKTKIGIHTKPKDKSASELNELLMEAKSGRDSSWYDVGTFLNHRATKDGEIMARVRFAGFDSSHDEWVNVKRAIRERSIPLQHSECHLVEVGDLVLCFRKTGDSDLYFDAHVTKKERNVHQFESCTCIFRVCYDHDNYEERVGLSRLCRRPSQCGMS